MGGKGGGGVGGPARKALRQMVVGQEHAQVSLSRLIDMHLAWFDMKNPENRSPNALIIGPTGTGKTHAIKIAAGALSIPYVVVDSTRLVSTGAGDHLTLEQVLKQLVRIARPLAKMREEPEQVAERGIIFLDEFDKLRSHGQTDDTAAIQRRLLQFIEGDILDLAPGEHEEPRRLNTQGILFIAAGAFTGIDKLVNKRVVGRGHAVGIQAEDVKRYGFLEELVARMPIIIRFEPLTEAELRGILDHPEVSPLNFYSEYFRRHGIELNVNDLARDAIAKDAAAADLGARGLHQELFPLLNALADVLLDESEPPGSFEVDETVHRQLKNGTFSINRNRNDRVYPISKEPA